MALQTWRGDGGGGAEGNFGESASSLPPLFRAAPVGVCSFRTEKWYRVEEQSFTFCNRNLAIRLNGRLISINAPCPECGCSENESGCEERNDRGNKNPWTEAQGVRLLWRNGQEQGRPDGPPSSILGAVKKRRAEQMFISRSKAAAANASPGFKTRGLCAPSRLAGRSCLLACAMYVRARGAASCPVFVPLRKQTYRHGVPCFPRRRGTQSLPRVRNTGRVRHSLE